MAANLQDPTGRSHSMIRLPGIRLFPPATARAISLSFTAAEWSLSTPLQLTVSINIALLHWRRGGYGAGIRMLKSSFQILHPSFDAGWEPQYPLHGGLNSAGISTRARSTFRFLGTLDPGTGKGMEYPRGRHPSGIPGMYAA